MFSVTYGPELTDTSDADYKYIQKIDWKLYNNPTQFFSSESQGFSMEITCFQRGKPVVSVLKARVFRVETPGFQC